MQRFEVGDNTGKQSVRPNRSTLKDYILVEASENSSARCSGCIFAFYIFIITNVLFGVRQRVYHEATDFDAIVAVESVLGVLGFIDYFETCELCQNDDGIADDVAAQCDDDLKSSSTDALIGIINNNDENATADCLYYLFGSDSDDADLCTSEQLRLQYNKETDTINCGVNSRNSQGCTGGYYQPSKDLDGNGPGKACPEGHWCPSDFTCKIPCPYGSLCTDSEIHSASGKCRFSHDVSPKKKPITMYNESLTCASTDDNVQSDVCPGAKKVPLCPAGFYCPLPTVILKCPRAHYCPLGSFEPIRCFRGKLSCPNLEMSYPLIFIPMTILVAFTFFCMTVAYVLTMRYVIRKRNERRLQQAAAIAERADDRKRIEDEHFNRVHSIAPGGNDGRSFLDRFKQEQGEEDDEDDEDDENFRIAQQNMKVNSFKTASNQLPPAPVVSKGRASDLSSSSHGKGGQMTVWLFLGCDLIAHQGIFWTSSIILIGGVLVAILYQQKAPIFGEWDYLGSIMIGLFSPVWVASGLGVFFLRSHKSALSEAEDKSRTQTSRLRSSTVSGFNRESESAVDASSHNMLQQRALSTMRITRNTQLLGSLKEKTETRVNIEVDKLGLRLNSNKRVVLAGVDGKIEAGSVTAIMGPSGAGKTTFMNALSGRANYGTTTGRILINGEENSVNNLGRLVGFVPQEDTMNRELTVREILKSYALLRLPRFYDHTMVERVVQDVIEALQLDHVSDSIIGDETKRGISGGQRKRVNVGMEMVADPSLLFLDEPTSGLDSTTSFDLVFALKALAKKGVNVITVLHQPSYPLYQMFTKVLLLGKGGRTVFLGASADALAYFTHLGYTMPPFVNPADFFMDVIAGKFKRAGDKGLKDDGTELFGLWTHNRIAYENDTLFERNEPKRLSISEENNKRLNMIVVPVTAEAYAHLEPAGFWRAFVVNVKRAITQHIRSMNNNIFDVFLHGGTGLFLGAANGEVQLATLGQALLMYSLGLGMTVGLASLRVFGSERVVFWREAADGSGMGLSPLPYFIAKNLTELPRIAILTFCVTATFYPFVKVLCSFWNFYGMSLMASWTVSGYAVFLSITFDEKSAQLILVILCLIHLLYGGIQTTLSQMSLAEYMLSWFSPSRWLIEDLFICHTAELSAVYRLPPTWYADSSDSLIGYLIALTYTDRIDGDHSPYWNILMNFWFGFLARLLAFLSLCYSNRAQMAKPPLTLSILRWFNGFLRVFVDDVDLEEDSRQARKRVKLWRRVLLSFFFSDEGDGKAHEVGGKTSRRFSAFDFSKSTLPQGRESNNVVNNDAINVDDLRRSEANQGGVKRDSLEPSLAFSFSGGQNYGEGESPFFRQSHANVPPTTTAI